MRPLTIAHISDLHLSAEYNRKNCTNSRRVLEYIARLGVDHVVLTGDIAANAEPSDFKVARNLLDSFGLLNPSRLSVVIGNHDIFGGVHVAEDILSFPKRCKHTDYERKVEEFREHFREAFQHSFFVSPVNPFPYAKVVGDVLFVGLNTVARYSRIGNPLGSNGEVEADQIGRLKTIMGADVFRGRRKIVLLHHHFSKSAMSGAGAVHSVWGAIEKQTMKLRGKKPLLKIFRHRDVDLVLHGHLHESMEYVRRGVRCLNAGGTVMGPEPGQLSVNILRVGAEGVGVSIHRLGAEEGKRRALAAPATLVESGDQMAA